MSTISLIIPTRRVADLDACIASYQNQYDELIVVDEEHPNLAHKINAGIGRARSEYVVVTNDDALLEKGDIHDLCTTTVVSPHIVGGQIKVFHAHCWACPVNLFWQVGGMCEEYDGHYYDDSDFWMRCLTHGYMPALEPKVMIRHDHPATTIRTMPSEDRERNNRLLFVEKWGLEGLRTTGCL